jgi:hypothetical protein
MGDHDDANGVIVVGGGMMTMQVGKLDSGIRMMQVETLADMQV